MLTEKDLMLIGALIDSRLDARFGAFQVKMIGIMDIKFQEFEKKVDEKFDKSEMRVDQRFKMFEMRVDGKFDNFATVIKTSFDEVFIRLDRIENPIDLDEDHPSWK